MSEDSTDSLMCCTKGIFGMAKVWLKDLFFGKIKLAIGVFYRVEASYLKVNLVIFQDLTALSEMVWNHYKHDGWNLLTTVKNATISRNSSKVCVQLDSAGWSDIGNGWRIKPECNPEIDTKSIVEYNTFNEIRLLYSSVDGESLRKSLDHRVIIEGLLIGEETVSVNLLIDTCSKHETLNTIISAEHKLSIKNLMSFKGKSNTKPINITEEIGSNYFAFGVLLLNDNGNYIRSIENELQRDVTAINCRILRDWSNGRRNAKPFEWHSLIETLKDIGLRTLADEVEGTLI